jgi:hypothetical protein
MEFGKSVSRKVAQTTEFPDHKINLIKLPHHTIETLGPNPTNATNYKAWQIFEAAWRKATYFLGSLMVYSSWLLPVLLIVVITAAAGLVLIVIYVVVVVVATAAVAAAVIIAVILIRPEKSLYDFKRVWLWNNEEENT